MRNDILSRQPRKINSVFIATNYLPALSPGNVKFKMIIYYISVLEKMESVEIVPG